MYLKRRIFEHRVRRMRLRAQAQQSPAAVASLFAPRADVPRARETDASVEDPRRRSRRIPVTAELSIRRAGSFGFQCRAFDLSSGGCRVEPVEHLEAGQRVVVRLSGLEPLGAQIAWVDQAGAGLRYEKPLHPAVFEHLVAGLV